MTINPAAVCFSAFAKPCTPPAFISMALVRCAMWVEEEPGDNMLKGILSIMTGYMAAIIANVAVFGFIILLLYPVEVQLLVTNWITRWE